MRDFSMHKTQEMILTILYGKFLIKISKFQKLQKSLNIDFFTIFYKKINSFKIKIQELKPTKKRGQVILRQFLDEFDHSL